MASLEMKIKAERRMRELLEEGDLPQPDEVEYGYGCIRLLWHGAKAAVIVDIDDAGEIGASRLARPSAPPGDPDPRRLGPPSPPRPIRGRSTERGKRTGRAAT